MRQFEHTCLTADIHLSRSGLGRPGPVPLEVQRAMFPSTDPALSAVHQPHLRRGEILLRQPEALIETQDTHSDAAGLPVEELEAFF